MEGGRGKSGSWELLKGGKREEKGDIKKQRCLTF